MVKDESGAPLATQRRLKATPPSTPPPTRKLSPKERAQAAAIEKEAGRARSQTADAARQAKLKAKNPGEKKRSSPEKHHRAAQEQVLKEHLYEAANNREVAKAKAARSAAQAKAKPTKRSLPPWKLERVDMRTKRVDMPPWKRPPLRTPSPKR